MEIIDSKEKINELIRSLPEKRICTRFGFTGKLHEGHHHILNRIKEQSDIVIADYVEHCDYLQNLFLHNEKVYRPKNYIDIISSASINKNIDYLVINKLYPDDDNVNIIQNSKNKFLKVLLECKRLNISYDLSVQSMFLITKNKLQYNTIAQCGPKIIVPLLIYEKLFSNDPHKPDPIMEFYKTEDRVIKSRTRIDPILSQIKNITLIELLKGFTKSKYFEDLLLSFKYYIQNPKFTILDLKTVEKLDEINDNCVLIFMSQKNSEFIYIKEGVIIE